MGLDYRLRSWSQHKILLLSSRYSRNHRKPLWDKEKSRPIIFQGRRSASTGLFFSQKILFRCPLPSGDSPLCCAGTEFFLLIRPGRKKQPAVQKKTSTCAVSALLRTRSVHGCLTPGFWIPQARVGLQAPNACWPPRVLVSVRQKYRRIHEHRRGCEGDQAPSCLESTMPLGPMQGTLRILRSSAPPLRRNKAFPPTSSWTMSYICHRAGRDLRLPPFDPSGVSGFS